MVAIATTIDQPLTERCVAALDLPPDDPPRIQLERSPHRSFGDYRLDLRRAAAARRPESVDWESLAASLQRLDSVEEASSIPPRVYLRFTTSFLLGMARQAVEELQSRAPSGGGRRGQVVTVGGMADSGIPESLGGFRAHVLATAVANLFEATGRTVQRRPDPDGTVPIGDVSVAPELLAGGNGEGSGQTDRLLRSLSHRVRKHELARAFATYSILRIPRTHRVVLDEPHLWRRAWPRFARLLRALDWCEDRRSRESEGVVDLTTGGEAGVREVLLAINQLPDAARVAAERFQPAAFVQALDDVARALDEAGRHGTVAVEMRDMGAIALRRGLVLLDVPVPSQLGVPMSG